MSIDNFYRGTPGIRFEPYASRDDLWDVEGEVHDLPEQSGKAWVRRTTMKATGEWLGRVLEARVRARMRLRPWRKARTAIEARAPGPSSRRPAHARWGMRRHAIHWPRTR